MTDSCPVSKLDRREMVDNEDVKSDFSSDPETQHSCIEEREHLQVYLRIRPFTSAERNGGESQDCVTIEPPDTVLLKPPSLSLTARLSTDRSLPQTGQHFQFSQVYGPETTQRELFEGTVKDLVKDVLEGGNSLVFTYGVTNAGKTFTFLGPDADPGLLPRSLDVVFNSIGEQVFPGLSIKPQRCREFVRLSREQQAEEAAFKRNLLRQFKENERSNVSLLNVANTTLFEGSSALGTTEAAENKISLNVETNTKFSVWVSFCEIYNENIHDLLEGPPSGALRRAALRLSQDVKGNAFVKDLRWVQVNDAEEAYKVVKLGKKNQSFSSTRLNHLSSRSHSMFSIRILRIEDVGTPRVHSVGEFCLCDLAGSERCAKTQNKGERLKEAGNINTSLLILGKCINALRHNQQARLLQHVPFRESKLTHYLQGFFCGRGKACMIVNVNQCASMYDETLNVLKFSAVAQKVVVLPSRPVSIKPHTSTGDASVILGAERKALRSSSRSSLIGWESSLEDVQEDEDDEFDEEISLMEDSMDQTGNDEAEKVVVERKTLQRQMALLKQLQVQLKKERAENLIMEARIREETSQEFTELFSNMQNDYEERLVREGEILEERAERRLELFKNLVDKMSVAGADRDAVAMEKFLEFRASALPGNKNCPEATGARPCSGRAVPQAEMEMRELDDRQQEALKQNAGEEDDDEEKRKLLLELQEKSSEIARLEKQLRETQKTVEADSQICSSSPPRDELQEALAALEKERSQRVDAVAALEYQTLGKEEALVSLKEEKKAKEEAVVSLEELKRLQEETAASLEGERRDKEKAVAALEAERRAKEEAAAALEQQERREELRSGLDEEKEELCRRLEDKLEAAERQVSMMEQSVQAQLDDQSKQIQEKCSEISSLTQEVQSLKQELETVVSSGGERLREEAETQRSRILDLESELKQNLLERKETMHKKLQEQEVLSKQRLEELEQKLRQQEETSSKVSEEAKDVKRLNSDLQTELASLKSKLSNMAATEETEERKEKEKLAELEKASAQREAELQKKLLEMETQVTCLQKSLQEAQERREEEESQAVQEARRREVERRRELLAVAHEAIAQKDEELEKKREEISRLKENSKQDAEKLKSLDLHLQRKEEDSSDLREKLADYKKQIQQIQKEISTMREEEKVLRQKLSDVEKTKKQLQSDVSSRDRTIQTLKVEQTSTKSDDTLQLYQKACKDLEAKDQVVEDMRLALTEQEDTQEQMEQVLDEKLGLVQELSSEVEKLKGMLLLQERGNMAHRPADSSSDELRRAKDETSQAQGDLKVLTEKHQAERRKWLDEKLFLIGQAKEAEDKRNQEMRKFAEDRERYTRQQSHLDSQLVEKDQTMETWRKERDTLVRALEVQLQKLLSSQAEKEKLIQELQRSTQPPLEVGGGASVEELQEALNQKEAEILHLKDELEASAAKQSKNNASPATRAGKPKDENMNAGPERRETRASISSQGSAGFPSVLESSEISTENGRTSRFPRPELEISFSPLQPNRMALRRQGEENSVTVKITRSARKRKSSEMDKEEVETENRRNTKTKVTPKLTPHKEESSSPAGCHDSPNSIRSRKDGALLKIGEFLQSSPTLFGSKAKKMMSLVSGRSEADSAASSSSLSLRCKKNKKKQYRPEISSPMDMPAHPIISREVEEKESDHQIIKRRLRSRVAK